jgi:hypothetical protein
MRRPRFPILEVAFPVGGGRLRCGLAAFILGTILAGGACGTGSHADDRLAKYLDGDMDVSELVQPAVNDLRSGKPEERARGAADVRGWLVAVRRGIDGGEIGWIQTPYMNKPWMNRGWDLIEWLPRYLSDPLPDEAVPIPSWYLSQIEPRFRSTGLSMLRAIQGPSADSCLVALVTGPHPDRRVVLGAVEEATDRSLRVPAAVLRGFASGHLQVLAAAARELNDRLGYPALAPFDSLAVLRSPEMTALMSRLDSLVVDRIPGDARYVQIQGSDDWPGLNRQQYRINGWLLSRSRRGYELYDLYGHYVKGAWADTTRDRFGGVTFIRTVTMAPFSLEEEAERIREPAFWGEPTPQASNVNRSGPFSLIIGSRGDDAGSPEIFEIHFAWWLYRYGPRDLCAHVLLKAIEDYGSDEEFLAAARIGIGRTLGYRMMVAFVGERDYAEALRLARLIRERYPDSPFAREAALLVDQLPGRTEDYRVLRLPTTREWNALRATLGREGQIAYLADRLRILNCDNRYYSQDQFAEPPGMTGDALHLMGRGTSTLVNPYEQLLPIRESGQSDSTSVDLHIADIPDVAGLLGDDRVILSVRYPSRNPGSTRWFDRVSAVAASLINAVADTELCDPQDFGHLSGPEREAYIAHVVEWAERNQGKSRGTMLLERLHAAPDYAVIRVIEDLAGIDPDRATAEAGKLLDSGRLDPGDRQRLLQLRWRISPAAVVPLALRMTGDSEVWVRVGAGEALAEAARPEGPELLRRELRRDPTGPASMRCLVALLRNPSATDAALADSILPALHDTLMADRENRGHTLENLIRVHRREGFTWLVEALADTGGTPTVQSHASGWIRLRVRDRVAQDLLGSDVVPDSLRAPDFNELNLEGRAIVEDRLERWARVGAGRN